MKKPLTFIKKHSPLIIFLLFSIVIRLFSITDSMFFTWDNGRDFFAVKQIMDGDLTLIGPTTGLPGFFLGPLWFYIGIPGYFLSGTSPYGFLMGYILMGFTALPLFWILSHKIFLNPKIARLNAYLLSVIPGSVWGMIRVWNPLIAIPLMCGVFLSLIKARKSKFYLGLSFFLLGLTLQAEFAYAIFIVAVLTVLIPWIRQKFDFKDFLISGLSLGLTLVPQILFEIRNNFVMTKALFLALFGDGMERLPWMIHLSRRPSELFNATKKLFIGGGADNIFPFLFFVGIVIVGLYVVYKKKYPFKISGSLEFAWQLLGILAISPYLFYMLWRGNHGYFFDYYITSHFIFLAPLFVLGLLYLKKFSNYLLVGVISFFVAYWYQSLYVTTLNPTNNAGLKSMDIAIQKLYEWIDSDRQDPGVVRIFTPNAETEHYDAILHWRAESVGKNIPMTIRSDNDEYWYVLIEPDYQLEKRLNNWYAKVAKGGVLTRREMVGDLRLESWEKVELTTAPNQLKKK